MCKDDLLRDCFYTNFGHQMFEWRCLQTTLSLLVKDSESHPDHFLVIDACHLVLHHVAKLGKLDLARVVRVILGQKLTLKVLLRYTRNLIENIEQLSLCRIQTQAPHCKPELLHWETYYLGFVEGNLNTLHCAGGRPYLWIDCSSLVHIKQIKGLLQLCYLFCCQHIKSYFTG